MRGSPETGAWSAPISVSELNLLTRQLIEQNIALLWVGGEVSNLTRAASGHCYFSLKDERAQVRCVMFRHRMQHLDWDPANGMQVEVRARPTLYEARGEFQLAVEFMRRAGLGALYEAFARLKAQLEKDGLFAVEAQEAAARVSATHRCHHLCCRCGPARRLDDLAPSYARASDHPVSGASAGRGRGAKNCCRHRRSSARRECDVLILCRGGGSIEDLVGLQRGRSRAIHLRVLHSPGLWRRPRNRLHHRRFCRGCSRSDAHCCSGVGESQSARVDSASRMRCASEWRPPSCAGWSSTCSKSTTLVDGWPIPASAFASSDSISRICDVRMKRAVSHALIRSGLRLSALRHRLTGAAPDLSALADAAPAYRPPVDDGDACSCWSDRHADSSAWTRI